MHGCGYWIRNEGLVPGPSEVRGGPDHEIADIGGYLHDHNHAEADSQIGGRHSAQLARACDLRRTLCPTTGHALRLHRHQRSKSLAGSTDPTVCCQLARELFL